MHTIDAVLGVLYRRASSPKTSPCSNILMNFFSWDFLSILKHSSFPLETRNRSWPFSPWLMTVSPLLNVLISIASIIFWVSCPVKLLNMKFWMRASLIVWIYSWVFLTNLFKQDLLKKWRSMDSPETANFFFDSLCLVKTS